MKHLKEHSFFVINALCIAGLIGMAWLIQNHSDSGIILPQATDQSAVSATTTTTAPAAQNAIPGQASLKQNAPSSAASSVTPSAAQSSTLTAPVIQRPRENEGAGGGYDE